MEVVVSGYEYPFSVTLLQTDGSDHKTIYCRTFIGAWWLLGQYRCTGLTVALQEYNRDSGKYVHVKSMKYTEYAY